MKEALRLAVLGYGSTAPNPMVGCVIVRDGQIVGRGWHRYKGGPHAEVYALQEAGELARGATAVVTLEPCNHHGATAPCTEALIRAGIKTVYIPFIDPNPIVNGAGIARLQAAGITVHIGLCAKSARQLNQIYFHYITTRRPFVTLKWAMSLDGQITTPHNQQRWITGEQARAHSHLTRQAVGAILVGCNTAMTDNPLLTARSQSAEPCAKQPWRIILDSKGRLPLNLKLFSTTLPGRTFIVTTAQAKSDWLQSLASRQIESWILPADEHGQVSLPALLQKLGENQITHLLVEGGAKIHASFIEQQLFNELHVYLAPSLIGSSQVFSGALAYPLTARCSLRWQAIRRVGNDLYLIAKGA